MLYTEAIISCECVVAEGAIQSEECTDWQRDRARSAERRMVDLNGKLALDSGLTLELYSFIADSEDDALLLGPKEMDAWRAYPRTYRPADANDSEMDGSNAQ